MVYILKDGRETNSLQWSMQDVLVAQTRAVTMEIEKSGCDLEVEMAGLEN